jgi:DNA-binding MurR/RpiR family transcriptional regulator
MPKDSATAPATVDEFRDRLAATIDTLPKRLRQCAEYISQHSERIAVSTVADLAAGANVPPSAVMRFCQILGFSGFSGMQRLFRDAYTPGRPDYATRLQNLKAGAADSPAVLVAEFVEAGRLSLEGLATALDEAALKHAVATLAAAETIHIIGFRRSFPVASYLAYVFEKMAVPAMLHDGAGHLDHRHAMRPGDAVLAISFAPYSDETLALARDARTRGLPVVALSDHRASPLARLAETVLTVAEVDFGAFRSLSATIALAISLAVAVGAAQR